jgi:hypothetical protein
MRLFMCGLGVGMSVLVDLSPVAASADCLADPPGAVPPNPACGVVKLGWRVVDPGPPIRFQPDDGTAGVELAVTIPGRPRPDEDPVRWAADQFSARPLTAAEICPTARTSPRSIAACLLVLAAPAREA